MKASGVYFELTIRQKKALKTEPREVVEEIRRTVRIGRRAVDVKRFPYY